MFNKLCILNNNTFWINLKVMCNKKFSFSSSIQKKTTFLFFQNNKNNTIKYYTNKDKKQLYIQSFKIFIKTCFNNKKRKRKLSL